VKKCILQEILVLIVVVVAAAAVSLIQEVEMMETCMAQRNIVGGWCRKILATLCF
jgi:hypothetical protein